MNRALVGRISALEPTHLPKRYYLYKPHILHSEAEFDHSKDALNKRVGDVKIVPSSSGNICCYPEGWGGNIVFTD